MTFPIFFILVCDTKVPSYLSMVFCFQLNLERNICWICAPWSMKSGILTPHYSPLWAPRMPASCPSSCFREGKCLLFWEVNRVTHVMGIVGADSTYHFGIADHAIGCTVAIYSMWTHDPMDQSWSATHWRCSVFSLLVVNPWTLPVHGRRIKAPLSCIHEILATVSQLRITTTKKSPVFVNGHPDWGP